MSKYIHLNDDEIISHIEKFGTKDEKELVKKLRPDYNTSPDDIDWDNCPYCSGTSDRAYEYEIERDEAIDKTEVLEGKIKAAFEALV